MSSPDPDDEFANLLGLNFEHVDPMLLQESGGQDNKSLVLKSQGSFSLEHRVTPILATGELDDVLVKVNFTAISGCDVSPLPPFRLEPFTAVSYCHFEQIALWRKGSFTADRCMVPGHESAGTVFCIGPAVTTLKIGDRVALEPILPCRSCSFCLAKTYHLCTGILYAATPARDGTLSKYYVLPEYLCAVLPASVSLKEGALVESLATAVHVVRESKVSSGSSVVIFGARPLGLLCCAVARACGAAEVVVIDNLASHVAIAKEYGATTVVNAGDTMPMVIARHSRIHWLPDGGVDVMIDTGGVMQSDKTAIHLIKHGGTYALPGIWLEKIHSPETKLGQKEIQVLRCLRYATGDYKRAIFLMESGKVDVKKLISTNFKFMDAGAAFSAQVQYPFKKVLIEGPEDE